MYDIPSIDIEYTNRIRQPHIGFGQVPKPFPIAVPRWQTYGWSATEIQAIDNLLYFLHLNVTNYQ